MSSAPKQRRIFHQPSKSPRRNNRVLGTIADALVTATAGMRILSGFIIVVVMLVTGYDVIMRYLFARPLEWSLPVCMLGLVIIVMFAIPNIAAQRSHIAMDLFYRKFSTRGKLVADVITNTATLIFSLVVGLTAAGASANFLAGGLRTSGNFNLPVWIDYAIVAVGLLVLALVVVLMPWQTRPPADAGEPSLDGPAADLEDGPMNGGGSDTDSTDISRGGTID